MDQDKVTAETREAERAEADVAHDADREPTPDEERAAEETIQDDDVARNYQDMAQRGVRQQGEGRIP